MFILETKQLFAYPSTRPIGNHNWRRDGERPDLRLQSKGTELFQFFSDENRLIF